LIQVKKIAVAIAVILIVAVAYYFVAGGGSSEIKLIGIVDANQVIVSPQIGGRIVKLPVDEGSEVKQGDLIAQLDTRELQAQQQAAAAAAASLKSKVAESEAMYRLQHGATTNDVANAEAQVRSSEANLEQARADLARISADTRRTDSLAEQGVASQSERDTADANLVAQQAKVRAAQDAVRAAQAALESTRAKTYSAPASLSDVQATRLQQQQAEAQSEQAAVQLGYTNVYAPLSGTVSVRVAREGEVVTPGEPIVTLVDFTQTWVRAPLPETYADKVGIGDALEVQLPGGDIIKGTVITKAAEGDFATQRDVSRRKRDIKTIGLKLLVPNPRHTLVPGMTAIVLLPSSKVKGK
jgi:multidrug resistance efflux pump